MSWAETEAHVDYEDARRPTADSAEGNTGWIAYYAWGRGGHGIHTPKYRRYNASDDTDPTDLRDHLVHTYERWMEHSEYARIVIHRNVVPPRAVIERELADALVQRGHVDAEIAALELQLEAMS